MKAVIREAVIDGEHVYQVIESGSVEYSTSDLDCAEKYCENNYGTEWGEE